MATAPMTAEPCTIQIADEELSDLRQQLQRTRWPDETQGACWGTWYQSGVSPAARGLVAGVFRLARA